MKGNAAKDEDENHKWKVGFVLRRTMDDVGAFDAPKDPSDAAGADFSWTRDGVSGNKALAAKGIAAVPFSWKGKTLVGQPYLKSVTVAPYIEFDRLRNSVDTDKNTDNLTFGGLGQAGYANFMRATHYFSATGEVVSSFTDGKPKNWAISAFYQPFGNPERNGSNTFFAYLGTPLPITKDIYYSISPKLVSEYRSALNDSTDAIFGSRKDALRSGPTVTFGLGADNILEKVPTVIQSVYFQATWGWLWDWLSQRDYQLLDTSLTFNIDPESHLGLTLSYTYGEDAKTGNKTNTTKVGLSAKF